MAEYIEREVVLNDIGELFTLCRETLPNEAGHHFIVEKELETHLDFVRNLPAADVRPVVLCKACEYYQEDCGWCGLLDIYGMNVNDFCSRWKKREKS